MLTRYRPNRPAAAIGGGDFWNGPFWWPQRLLRPPNSLFGPWIWNQWPRIPTCAYWLYGFVPFNSLGGHYALLTASEIRWPQIWNQWPQPLTYPCAYCLYGMISFDNLQTASKQPQRSDMTSDLKSVSPSTYISMRILLMCFGPFLRPFWRPQRPVQHPNGLRVQIYPRFGICGHNYICYHVRLDSLGLCSFIEKD